MAVSKVSGSAKNKELFLFARDLIDDLRNEYIIADYINLFVFYVYTLRNYNNLKKLDKEDIEYQYAYNRYLGSLLIVIGFILEIDYYYKTTTFSK